MSRYYSPYATRHRSSRWPWLVALLIVAAMLAAGGVLLRDHSPGGLLQAAGVAKDAAATPTAPALLAQQLTPAPAATTPTGEPVPTPPPTTTAAAQPTIAQPAAAVTASVVAGSQTDLQVAALPAAQSLGGDATGGLSQAAPATTGQDASAAPASPAPGTQPAVAQNATSPTDAVQAFAQHWSAGDYDGLYSLLTAGAQQTLARAAYADQHHGDTKGFDQLTPADQQKLGHDAFVTRYTGITDMAGLTSVTLTVTGAPNLQTQVPVHVAMTSSKVDPIAEDNVFPLRKENGAWKVDWTPSLIFKDLADGCVAYAADPVTRGSILDRKGKPLAYDGKINQVTIIPGQLENETAELQTLSQLIGISPADIKAKYKDAQPNWWVPIKDFPQQIDPNIVNGIANLKGVALRTPTARVYPLGAKAAHITGYVTKVTKEDLNADKSGTLGPDALIGRAGIEYGANDLLTGKPGGRLSVVECQSRQVRQEIARRRPVPARDVILTIDSDLQTAVDAALGNVKGSSVILDPRTGAVRAMVSHPSYDPNWFVLGFSDKDWKFVNDDTKRPLLNRATQAGYPTGSIFKVITMAAGMEDLGYTGDTQFDCPQQWSIPNTNTAFNDWTVEEGLGAQGTLTLHQALVNSCNTIFYQIGYALDQKDNTLLPNMAKAFGLGAPTGIPYLPEIAGTLPSPAWKQQALNDYWATGDAINLSIGQGYLEATPLQMANVYATIANGSALLQPFIVEYTRDAGGTQTRVGQRTVIRKAPVKKENLQEIRSALRDQTSSADGVGSFRVFGDFPWPIAGKTGTAQNQLNKAEKPHSWFAAFGPYGAKVTIASIVMVESSGEGVQFAAPVTRQIYEAYLKSDLATGGP